MTTGLLRLAGLLTLAALICGTEARAQEAEAEIDGKPVSTLLAQLRGANRGLQLRAAQALVKAPAEARPQIVPKLLPILQSERENDRFVAAQVLGEYGPAARAAIPELLPILEGTQYERNRAAAAKALGQILTNAPPSDEVEKVVRALVAKLDDKYVDVAREAVLACGTIGPAAKGCIPALAQQIGQGRKEWQEANAEIFDYWDAVAWTCGRMGPLAAVHVDRLLGEILRTGNTQVIDALGEIGPVQPNMVPNIVAAMEKINAGSVHIVVPFRGLGARTPPLGGEQAVALMQHGFNVLAGYGEASAPAVEFASSFLAARNKTYVLGALKVLQAVGPKAASAAKEIEEKALKSSDPEIAKAAEEALVAIRGKK
jgi:hypothetical protein